ncbi:MAG: DNA-binding protein WhiA, partial [Lachnospiraceae bacterium]|nr:DNA-binding protein WhiA [Lachnospiraceae bacterium]
LNKVNRQLNCDTANVQKTLRAAQKQLDDIQLIRDSASFATLPETLKEIAQIRLDNPDLPLTDLGQMLAVPIGKSGVSHRLKRLSEIADSIRSRDEN